MITVSVVLEDGLTIPINLDAGATIVDLTALDNKKVDKVAGKGLSTNDFTNEDKANLDNQSGTNTGDQNLSALIDNSTDTYTSEAKIMHVVSLTQNEYDAIETPDENTLYYIPTA